MAARQAELDTAESRSRHYFDLLKTRIDPSKQEEQDLGDVTMAAAEAAGGAKSVLDSVKALTQLLASPQASQRADAEGATESLATHLATLNANIEALTKAS
eukprot:2155740-Alexandrium_andersonii.AAC.1